MQRLVAIPDMVWGSGTRTQSAEVETQEVPLLHPISRAATDTTTTTTAAAAAPQQQPMKSQADLGRILPTPREDALLKEDALAKELQGWPELVDIHCCMHSTRNALLYAASYQGATAALKVLRHGTSMDGRSGTKQCLY